MERGLKFRCICTYMTIIIYLDVLYKFESAFALRKYQKLNDGPWTSPRSDLPSRLSRLILYIVSSLQFPPSPALDIWTLQLLNDSQSYQKSVIHTPHTNLYGKLLGARLF
jgi:hypothetical protein